MAHHYGVFGPRVLHRPADVDGDRVVRIGPDVAELPSGVGEFPNRFGDALAKVDRIFTTSERENNHVRRLGLVCRHSGQPVRLGVGVGLGQEEGVGRKSTTQGRDLHELQVVNHMISGVDSAFPDPSHFGEIRTANLHCQTGMVLVHPLFGRARTTTNSSRNHFLVPEADLHLDPAKALLEGNFPCHLRGCRGGGAGGGR